MKNDAGISVFRALEPWEVELVSGGNGGGEDIVVYGGGGGGGGGGDGGGGWGWGGYGGGYGGDGGNGDGGGGYGGVVGGDGPTTLPPIQTTDANGNSLTIEPRIDLTNKTADLGIIAANSAGSLDVTFNLPTLSVETFKLNLFDGNATYSATINVGTNFATGNYSVDFGGGATGSFSLGTNGQNFSIGISFRSPL
jgi:hypothetical protein